MCCKTTSTAFWTAVLGPRDPHCSPALGPCRLAPPLPQGTGRPGDSQRQAQGNDAPLPTPHPFPLHRILAQMSGLATPLPEATGLHRSSAGTPLSDPLRMGQLLPSALHPTFSPSDVSLFIFSSSSCGRGREEEQPSGHWGTAVRSLPGWRSLPVSPPGCPRAPCPLSYPALQALRGRKRDPWTQLLHLGNHPSSCWSSRPMGRTLIGSQNHRRGWVGKALKDHQIPAPLPWAGTPSTRPGCPEPHPAWP